MVKHRNTPYSLAEIDTILSSKKWKRLGVYTNATTPMTLQCPNGHVVEKALSWFMQGSGCAICSGNTQLTNDVIDSRLDDGWVRLSEYVNAQRPMVFLCSKGHKVSICWKHYQQGHRCRKCHYEKISGKNCHLWNDSLTDDDRHHTRLYSDYYAWRVTVLERDNYTCQVCAKRGGKLECHHLNSYSRNRLIGTDPDNGVVLCVECHKEFHRIFDKKNNTVQQFLEFLDIVNDFN